MAAAAENKIREELQRKKIREVYVLAGEDAFKQDYYADRIQEAAFPEGVQKQILYGDEVDPNQLLEQVRTLSLWDPHKFLLVRQAERFTAKQWEALLPLLKEPLERCVVVFQSAKADARLKFFQALGKAGERAALVKLEPAQGSEWNFWLQTFLRESKLDVDDEARLLLAHWTAGSLSDLKHTLERAALFAGAEKIRKEHVLAVGFKVSPEDVFRFTEKLLSGDRQASLVLLESLLSQGEEPLALVGLLSRQYRWLLAILTHRAEGKTDGAIASAAGIFPAAGKVLFPAAKRMGSKSVIRGLNALAETDHGLKSSRLPREQMLTELVVQLTEI